MKLIFIGYYDLTNTYNITISINKHCYIDWGDSEIHHSLINHDLITTLYKRYNKKLTSVIVKIYEFEKTSIDTLVIDVKNFVNIYIDSKNLHNLTFNQNNENRIKQLSINCPNLNSIALLLPNCDSLIKILRLNLKYNANVYESFYNCRNLEIIPCNIIDNNYKYLKSAFYNCKKLNEYLKLLLII